MTLTLQRGELQPLVLQQLAAADPYSSPVCVAAPDLALTTQAVKLPEALTKEEGGLLACHQHIHIVEGAGLDTPQQVQLTLQIVYRSLDVAQYVFHIHCLEKFDLRVQSSSLEQHATRRPASRLGRFIFVRCYESIRKNFIIFESLLFEPVNEDRPAGVPGEDPAALVVAVGVVRQAHCAGELPDDRGEGCLDSVLGDDVEIVEGDEKFVELGFLAGPFEW